MMMMMMLPSHSRMTIRAFVLLACALMPASLQVDAFINRAAVTTLHSVVHSAATPTDADAVPLELEEQQADFTMGYLNKHHSEMLRAFAETFSELGVQQQKKNAWSGESYMIEQAKIVGIDLDRMQLEVTVQERGKAPQLELVSVDLDAKPISNKRKQYAGMPPISRDLNLLPVDNMVRRLNRLCWIVDHPGATGKLLQLGIQIGGARVGEIKENLYLNQVPHNRYCRKYFYDMASESALEAVDLCSQGKISNRMKLISMFPEMNPSMDSYRYVSTFNMAFRLPVCLPRAPSDVLHLLRFSLLPPATTSIGTIMEMTRAIAIRLAEQNLRVRICVQQSMGVGIFTGIPKQLSGVARLFQMMDWASEEGEENEGMVGNFINFGSVGKEHVVNAHVKEDGTKVYQDDVLILVCPQSMLGIECSIMEPLSEMVKAAGDRPIILINPDLDDKVSAQGQQSVRGRKDRMEFADSFKTIWHFQNIYVSGTSYFPILGSMSKLSPLGPWVAHQRRDLRNNEGELYVPVLAGEDRPSGQAVLETFAQ
jgi:adenylate kinase